MPTPYSPAAAGHALLGHFLAVQGIGHLDQDAGAVAHQLVGTHGTPVVQVLQDLQPCLTMSCDFLPLMWATKPTPQASCSLAGEYRPCTPIFLQMRGWTTAIAPSLRHHAGAHRVQVDVDHAGQQIALRLDQRGAVAPLPQRATAGVALVEIAHITAPHRLHHLRQRLSRCRCGQQVKVVVHQHIGMDRHRQTYVRFAPAGPAWLRNPGCPQRWHLAVVAALNDVVRVAGKRQTGQAGHLDAEDDFCIMIIGI
jgi:hypothetical protein